MYKKIVSLTIVVLVLFCILGTAAAAIQDSYTTRHAPNINYGSGDIVTSSPRSSCNTSDNIGFIKFDLEGLPEDPESVWMSVYHTAHTTYCYSNCTADFYFYEVTSDWDEMTLTYDNSPNIGNAVYGPVHITFPNDFGRREYNITDIYKQWKNGTKDNYGLAVYSPDTGCNNAAVGFSFYSSDYEDESMHPYLRIVDRQEEVWVDDDFDSDTAGWRTTHFADIQAGVDAAAAAGTVNVAAGTYTATEVDKEGLVIRGQEGAVVDGNNEETGYGFAVTEPGVTIEGFTIKNWSEAGILLTGAGTAHNSIVRNNTIQDNQAGIAAYTNGNTITGNTVTNSVKNGIYVRGTQNTINNNNAAGNGIDGSWIAGIFVEGNNNTVSENTASNNLRIGIRILGDENTIQNNTASNNGTWGGWRGIHLEGNDNSILDNTVNGNNSDGIEFDSASSSNLISNNTVENNRDNGISVRGTNHTIENNIANGNGYSGIKVNNADSGSDILNNTVTGNSEYGIDSRGLNYISGNTVAGNGNSETERGGGLLVREGDTIYANKIYENHNYGIFTYHGWENEEPNPDADVEPIDAALNWWGSVSGPLQANTNPYGSGNSAADHITFSPWLLSASGNEDPAATRTDSLNAGDTLEIPGVVSASVSTGSGTVTVGQYDDNPTANTFSGNVGSYVDVYTTTPDDIDELFVKLFYEGTPENESYLVMYWWDGSNWAACSNSGVNVEEKYVWAIITADSLPSLSDLTGTEFGAGCGTVPPADLDVEPEEPASSTEPTEEDLDLEEEELPRTGVNPLAIPAGVILTVLGLVLRKKRV